MSTALRMTFSDTVKHVVQFSGGAGSAVAAKLVIDEFGPEDVVLLFHDTKAEHPDAKRFREEVAAFLGVPITERSDGRSLWQVIEAHNSLPSSFMGFCTDELKARQGETYLRDLEMAGQAYVVYNGMGADEEHRIARIRRKYREQGRALRSPLDERGITDPKSIVASWGIALPECYRYFKHNNCIPCFKATGLEYWYNVWLHHRAEYERAAELEERFGYTVRRGESLRELTARFAQGPDPKWEAERHRCAICFA